MELRIHYMPSHSWHRQQCEVSWERCPLIERLKNEMPSMQPLSSQLHSASTRSDQVLAEISTLQLKLGVFNACGTKFVTLNLQRWWHAPWSFRFSDPDALLPWTWMSRQRQRGRKEHRSWTLKDPETH